MCEWVAYLDVDTFEDKVFNIFRKFCQKIIEAMFIVK